MELKKSWGSANITPAPRGNDAVDAKGLFVQIKNAIVGFGHPVEASCNGVLVSDKDVIVGPSDIVTPLKDGTGPRSWVVIRLGAFTWLCVEFNDAAYNKASFYVGGQFTGGSLDQRPRAPDEMVINRAPWWVTARGGQGGAYGATVMSAEGSLRVIVGSHKQDGEVVWLFERGDGWTFSSMFSGPLTAGEVRFDDGRLAPGYIIHEVAGSHVLAESTCLNEINQEHMMFPVGIFSCGQKLGYVEDLWATSSPPAKSRDEIGSCVVVHGNAYPWGGSVDP